jgi:hypothetical protein
MNTPKLSQKNIIIGIVCLVALSVLIYMFFIKSDDNLVVVDVITAQNAGISANSGAVGQDIILLVDKFEAVSIDTSLFSSSLFNSLKDFSVTVSPESQGRKNPFILVGVESSDTDISTTQTKSQNSKSLDEKFQIPSPVSVF